MQRRNGWRVWRFALISIGLLGSTLARADDLANIAASAETPTDRADQALYELLGVLDEQTELATKSKLNVDFVPGMVTVLHGGDLLARGVRTVAEALTLIPGVEMSMGSDGQQQILVRGIGKTFSSAKVRIMLNNVQMNPALASVPVYMLMPIEQVDRIEFVRGPGSAVYGEYAYAGVLNVITRKHGRTVFGRYSDHDWTTAGAHVSHQTLGDELKLSLAFAGNFADAGEVTAGNDFLKTTPQAAISNSPGLSNEKQALKDALLHVEYRDYGFAFQYVNFEHGDHFGTNDALPEPEQKLVRGREQMNVEGRRAWVASDALSGMVKLGWRSFVLASDGQRLYPAGFRGGYPDGVRGDPHYEETNYYLTTEANYQINARNLLLGGIEYSDTKQGDTYTERNFNPNTLQTVPGPLSQVPYQRYYGDDNWMGENQSRRLIAFYLQDQYAATAKLKLTLGLRHDGFSDVDNRTTPRVAAVYQISDADILKAQYSEAFRPPSFLEKSAKNNPVLAGNPDIDIEVIENSEFAYIHNDGVTVTRATVFYALLHDLVAQDRTTRRYQNSTEDAATYGAELEYLRPLGVQFKLDTNLTWVNAKFQDSNQSLPGFAEWLGNVSLIYQPVKEYSLAGRAYYVGERNRESLDTRDALDGYTTLDLTASAFLLEGRRLAARLGVKNVFDQDVTYAAPVNTYPGDYPRPGREIWLGLDYSL